MGSKKRSAWTREKAAFAAELDGAASVDDLFARERERQDELAQERDDAQRWKACERKTRYDTRADAEDAAAACVAHGAPRLHVYRCRYCGGWHLTSHPHS